MFSRFKISEIEIARRTATCFHEDICNSIGVVATSTYTGVWRNL